MTGKLLKELIFGAGNGIDPRRADDLLAFAGSKRFAMVLADPPWRFNNRTGKMALEHRRLSRYSTMAVEDIAARQSGRQCVARRARGRRRRRARRARRDSRGDRSRRRRGARRSQDDFRTLLAQVGKRAGRRPRAGHREGVRGVARRRRDVQGYVAGCRLNTTAAALVVG